jgi:hypothetical protein
MLTVLGLKSSSEEDKPWWRKESYVQGNELLNCLLQEYMISTVLRKFDAKSKAKISKKGMGIKLEQTGGIDKKIFLGQTVVGYY